MSNRYTVWVGLMMFAGIVETNAADVPAAPSEQEIAAFVTKVAQSDLRSLEEVKRLVRGGWSLQKSSENETTGPIFNEAKSIDDPRWLSGATYVAYVMPEDAGSRKLNVTSIDLTIEFRKGICFTGEQFKQLKYQRDTLEDWANANPLTQPAGSLRCSQLKGAM